jgi:GTP:adenosylcobinamide-phosphate guanylyltransferase
MPRVPPEVRSFSVIILAAQRRNQVNELASAAGVSHKCLVPIAGQPLIRHVVEALADIPGLDLIRICVEETAFAAVRDVLADVSGCAIDFARAADNLADSVHSSMNGLGDTIVITTADHVLLLPSSVEALLDRLDAGADAAVAFARQGAVLAAHPDGQRRFYRFADDSYSNCNLYGVAGRRGHGAIEIFRGGGQFAKNPRRIALQFGLFNLLLVRFALVSLSRACERISRQVGLRMEPVVLADGSQAIDVDNERTYRVAEQLLGQRKARRETPERELVASPS